VVLVHGFTQTSRCWGRLDEALVAADHEVVALDVPGHGQSSEVNADVSESASLLAATGGRGTYLGYSMGGRLSLRLAVDDPETSERLILISATPGIESESDRADRVAADDERASELERIGTRAFVDTWLEMPMFDGLTAETDCRSERYRNDAVALATSLRLAGTGNQEPMWDRLESLAMPVLLLTGAEDGKFTEIATRMQAAIGANAAHQVISGAGHSPHLERPDDTHHVVLDWLSHTAQ
jgi:2-succinyl-6-hydroxy-2,4-cyclohexadiene-1-carboxylate synthase